MVVMVAVAVIVAMGMVMAAGTGLIVFQRQILRKEQILAVFQHKAGGLPDGEYDLGGQKVFVKGIQCRLESGTIAGSVLRLHKAVQNIAKFTNWDLPLAVAAASLAPAKSINVDDRKGSLEVGKDADILLADADFEIIKTFVGGNQVYGN